jgi:hypothetical protein
VAGIGRHFSVITLSIVLLGALFVGFAMIYDRPPEVPVVHSLRSAQEADAPAGYPVDVAPDDPGRIPEFDPRFLMLDAFERFRIPSAPRFDQPLGSEHGALVYNAQAFFEMNDRAGKNHWGDDLNGIGGMNTDLGDPVYAIGNGLVLYAADRKGGWGNIVVLGHRLADGRIVQSMYAHLDRIKVPRGALVGRGQQIGTVGTAGGRWPAHLHFELYEAQGIDTGRGYALFRSNRLDPSAFLAEMESEASDDLSRGPLVLREAPTWEGMILEGAEKVPGLFGDK